MFAIIAPSSDSCNNHEEVYRGRWKSVKPMLTMQGQWETASFCILSRMMK